MMRTEYPRPDVTERLDMIMREQGSDAYWARILGKNRKTCCSYRNGWSCPSINVLWKICAVTKTDANWILFGDHV